MVLNLPFVSVLVPIRNEAAYIDRCLQAVVNQDYPKHLIEIFVSDGMSDDGTREIVAKWSLKDSRVRLFDNPRMFVSFGLNILTPKTKGDVLIRVDGHCVIAPDYIYNCVKHLQSSEVDGVGGPMHSIGEDKISQMIAVAMSSKFGVGNSSFRTEKGKTKFTDTVPFPAYKRSIVERVGLYDEELIRNQDDEYNYRIRAAGGKILLAEDVQSVYFSRGSLKKLWKQYFGYGYWKVRVFQKHPRQLSLRQFVPLLFVLGLILSIFLSIIFSWGWILLGFLVSFYSFANLTAAIIEAHSHGLDKAPFITLCFATIHISYGFGFLYGLFKFWNRWNDRS